MFGVIMAGGQGSRLRPLTLTRPKPMVEVLMRPVIDYVKDAMLDAGCSDIIVTTGYRGEQLLAHVDTWQSDSCNARINQESTPMGTAGSVRLLADELTQTFVVGSGDSVASFDIKDLVETHKRVGAAVTMALWKVDDPTEFGIVGLSSEHNGEVDGELSEGYIRKFKEKPTIEEAFSNVINAGLYIIEPEIIRMVPQGEKYDFSKQLFPRVLEMGLPMYAKTIDGVWFDVGHPNQLVEAQKELIQRRDELPFPMPSGTVVGTGGFHADGCEVEGESTESVISTNCVISQGAIVSESLLMANCRIASGAQVSNSILGQGVIVHEGAILDGVVVGDGQEIAENSQHENTRIPEID